MRFRLWFQLLILSLLTSCGWTTLKFDNKLNISGRFLAESTTSSLTSQNTTINALTCIAPTAYLSKLNSQGERLSPPVAEAKISTDGSYSLKLTDASLMENTQPLIIDVKGCASGTYSRPVTASTNQDVTVGSSLISYMLNSEKRTDVVEALTRSTNKMSTLLSAISPAASFQDAYSLANSNSSIQNLFNDLFDIAPTALLNSYPEVVNVQVPSTAQELQATPLVVQSAHWSSSYATVYTWKFDSQVIGHSSSLSWTPGANAQGVHAITLVMGENNGSGEVDLSKPYREIVRPITLTNNILPESPTLSITSPVVSGTTPINTATLTLGVATGTNRIYCSSFSSMAITEQSSTPPASSVFNYSCTQAGVQSISYNLLSTGDGEKTLNLWVKDSSGTISLTPASVSFFIDRGIPVASITSSGASLDNQSSRSFSLAAVDDGGIIARFECQLDAGTFATCSNPATITSLADGSHTFRVRAVDTAGNVSVAASQTWITDRTLPTVSFSSTPAAVSNQLNGTFNFSASDSSGNAIQGYTCSVDGGTAAACISPYVAILTAGTHTVSIVARDAANNLSNPLNYSWTIDTTPPTATIGSKPSSTTNSTAASFSFSATDSGGGTIASYECSLDSGTFAACSSPQSYSSLTSASHSFRVRANDTAGNVSSIVSYNWLIDTTTPLASINSAPDSITNSASASFSFSANPPPAGSITGYQCSIDGAAYASCSSPRAYGSLAQDSHTFSVKSVDNNSAVSDPVTHSWVIDLTNPVATYSATPASLIATASANFSFSATDTGGGSVASYQCKLDAASYITCSSPYSVSSLTDGSHTMLMRAIDTAGNTSAAVSHTWTVDTSAPVLNLSSTPAALTNSLSASFVFSATDAVAVSSYRCTVDGGASSTCTSPLNLSSLTAGAHTFAVTATDSSGNTSLASTFNWTIDTTAPTVSLSSTPASFTNTTTASFVFSGSDTGGATVATYNCRIDAGSYATCTSPQAYTALAAGSHTFYMTVTDTAGNTSSPISYSWAIDTTPPTVTITTPSTNNTVVSASALSSYPIAGSCSENGIVVTISGSVNATATCASGGWSTNVSLTALSEGSQSIQASQTDISNNTTTSPARTFIKDSVAPSIAVLAPTNLQGNGSYGSVTFSLTELNVTTGASFNVEFYNGSTWSSVGSKTVTAGANSNQWYTYSPFTVPNANSASARLRVSFTDTAGNSTTTTSTAFVVDSIVPIISGFTANGGTSATTNNNVPLSFSGTDTNNITQFCIKYNSSSQPVGTDSCWTPIQNTGVTAASSVTISNYFYRLGLASGTYMVYAWVKDSVGNISTNTATSGTDVATINFTAGVAPTVTQVLAASSDTISSPATNGELTVPTGQSVYIKWQASSTAGFGANPIQISYTTDDTNWTTIGSQRANSAGTGCTISGALTGCYRWTNGSPSNLYFRVRVKATDVQNQVGQNSSPALNSTAFKFHVGNTEGGVGGSSTAGVFINTIQGDVRKPDVRSLVVHPSGAVYFRDASRGILKVDPSDGILRQFIPATGITSSGDGGPVSAATIRNSSAIALDYQNNLLIHDWDRIRKVDLQANPPTITTIIGGGSNDANDVADPLDLLFHPNGANYAFANRMHPIPNGDILFKTTCYGTQADNPLCANRFRWYHHATNSITSVFVRGPGIPGHPSVDIGNCGLFGMAPLLDNSNNITGFLVDILTFPASGSPGCNIDSNYHNYTAVLDTTGNFSATTPQYGGENMFTLGRDGKIYAFGRWGLLQKYDQATNDWIFMAITGEGVSPDGTPLSSARLNFDDVFIDQNSKIYFPERGAIRTVTDDGKLATLMGQPLSYGDGLTPSQARFGSIKSIGVWNDGAQDRLVILDGGEHRIRETSFNAGSLISTIAGTGKPDKPNLTLQANTQPIFDISNNSVARFFGLDPSGNIYLSVNDERIGRLTRSTGLWSLFIGGGATSYKAGDGLTGTDIFYFPTNNYGLVGGYGGGNILMRPYMEGDNFRDDPAYKLYSTTTGIQSPLASYTGRVTSATPFCTDGTSLDNCLLTDLSETSNPVYVDYDGSWVIGMQGWGLKKLTPGGNLESYLPLTSYKAIAINKTASHEYVYYCDYNTNPMKIKKINMQDMTSTYLDWPVNSIACDGENMIYSASRNSLIFIYKQNGLNGVIEYPNP